MPAVSERAIQVKGLRDLQRAFSRADRALQRDLRKKLREVGEPVRADAEHRAAAEISHIGGRWSRMRVGITRSLVYVAPRERGVKTRGPDPRRRPNLAGLLMEKAMQPALDAHIDESLKRFEGLLDTVGKEWER